PNLDHPYDCSPYYDDGNREVVDGPVGIVKMPFCLNSNDTTEAVYPENDGVNNDTCDGDYERMVRMSIRLHLGHQWTGYPRNPCVERCFGYNLVSLTQECPISSKCTGTFKVDAPIEFDDTATMEVDAADKADEWDGTYDVDTVNTGTRTFTVKDMDR